MKPLAIVISATLLTFCASVLAEEVSSKEGIKTGAETIVNGTALNGITGAMSELNQIRSYDSRKAGARTWTELGDMHPAARPRVADFGK